MFKWIKGLTGRVGNPSDWFLVACSLLWWFSRGLALSALALHASLVWSGDLRGIRVLKCPWKGAEGISGLCWGAFPKSNLSAVIKSYRSSQLSSFYASSSTDLKIDDLPWHAQPPGSAMAWDQTNGQTPTCKLERIKINGPFLSLQMHIVQECNFKKYL